MITILRVAYPPLPVTPPIDAQWQVYTADCSVRVGLQLKSSVDQGVRVLKNKYGKAKLPESLIQRLYQVTTLNSAVSGQRLSVRSAYLSIYSKKLAAFAFISSAFSSPASASSFR